MSERVKCRDCDHLYRDAVKRLHVGMLSCRAQQDTPEGRASYVGTEVFRSCARFVVRRPTTIDPMIAVEAAHKEFHAQVVEGKGRMLDLPGIRPLAPPPKRSEVATNSPFDLGARRPPPTAPAKSRDPFDLEAA